MALPDTYSDKRIKVCLRRGRSFAVVAGAGSGKTTSLVKALEGIRASVGQEMRATGKRVACITYTNGAVAVIRERLGADDLFLVSTIHGFLWQEIRRFQREIRDTVATRLIPLRIAKRCEEDNGGQSQRARAARRRIAEFESAQALLAEEAVEFTYEETGGGSRYAQGRLDHDDIIDLFGLMVAAYPVLRKIIGQKFPYVLVDEAQDTFPNVIEALNSIVSGAKYSLVGYFGDPMQQIFEGRAGNFRGPPGSVVITKPENYRCSLDVIELLNAFRTDVRQKPGPRNVKGSVEIRLIQAEPGQGPRNTYTADQLQRAGLKFDAALSHFGWADDLSVQRLFLARQMIARRLGFATIHQLFTGDFASQSAQTDYEEGKHFLLAPFVRTLWPLVRAQRAGDWTSAFNILKRESPRFDPAGGSRSMPFKQVAEKVKELVNGLSELWTTNTKQILKFAGTQQIIAVSPRLEEHLSRPPRHESYDEETFGQERADWLADAFFEMPTDEIPAYVNFMQEDSPFSTQHGVKGEEYKRVLVVFDDTEANWNVYNFERLLAPTAAGREPTDGQRQRGLKLAYVCFSRAEQDLRIILYTRQPELAKGELIKTGLFRAHQISLQLG